MSRAEIKIKKGVPTITDYWVLSRLFVIEEQMFVIEEKNRSSECSYT